MKKEHAPFVFVEELTKLLNRCSLENGSNTPDFILADYLKDCLQSWNIATQRREAWYGRSIQPPPSFAQPKEIE